MSEPDIVALRVTVGLIGIAVVVLFAALYFQ